MDGFFTTGQVQRAGDLEDGLAGWWVDLPDASYRGKAVAPAEWTAEQVVEALNRQAVALGDRVLQGRLYARTVLGDR